MRTREAAREVAETVKPGARTTPQPPHSRHDGLAITSALIVGGRSHGMASRTASLWTRDTRWMDRDGDGYRSFTRTRIERSSCILRAAPRAGKTRHVTV